MILSESPSLNVEKLKLENDFSKIFYKRVYLYYETKHFCSRSEHERHSPSCPFVKGEHTQNVPLSVTYATQPALPHSATMDKIACLSTTASEDYIATATKHGNIVLWNLKHKMRVRKCLFSRDVKG